jgi:hypothetical protein
MAHDLKNFFKSINEISSHGLLLFVSLLAAVVLFCLLPALLHLAIMLLAVFSK